jgi:hypothetical protein
MIDRANTSVVVNVFGTPAIPQFGMLIVSLCSFASLFRFVIGLCVNEKETRVTPLKEVT